MTTHSIPVSLAVSELTIAERARTVLSSAEILVWSSKEESGAAQFVEEVGSPTLVLSRTDSDDLLAVERGQLQTCPHPTLGTLRLAGGFWPLTDDASLEMLRAMWCQHADCGVACRNRLSRLVGVRVERAEIWLPEEGRLHAVDLEQYQAARPNEILATGVKVAAHLNTDHLSELRQAAGSLSGLSPDQVLSARMEWIDDAGFDLSLIDADGGRLLRHPFHARLGSTEELSSVLHQTLSGFTG